MNMTNRSIAAVAAACILTLALSGCGNPVSTTAAPSASAASASAVPPTFLDAARWTASASSFAATRSGVAIVTSLDEGATAVIEFHSQSGALNWTSVPVAPATALYETRAGGRDWVIAQDGSSVLIFDARAGGPAVAPSHSSTFAGDTTLTASGTGLLVRDANGAHILDPASGVATSILLPADVTPLAVYGSGILLARGQTLVGLHGENGGWNVEDHRPKTAGAEAVPEVAGRSGSVVLVRWGGTLAVHRVTDGQVLASTELPAGDAPTFAASLDTRWATYGTIGFDLAGGAPVKLPKGFSGSIVFDAISYGTVDGAPALLDLITGTEIDQSERAQMPTAFTAWRDGIFVTPSEDGKLNSLTIAPLNVLN